MARGFSLALLAAVLAPLRENWRTKPGDGFPFSPYPMFSKRRRRHVTVFYLVGLDTTGKRHVVPYSHAGIGGLNQVRRQLRRRILAGEADAVCRSAARSVARRGKDALAEVIEVRVLSGRYELAGYFEGRREPVAEKVYAVARVSEESRVGSPDRRAEAKTAPRVAP